jgi:hypothetical protein
MNFRRWLFNSEMFSVDVSEEVSTREDKDTTTDVSLQTV